MSTAVAARDWPAPVAPPFPEYSYAFQPIVDIVARSVFSYEALVRGPRGEPAFQVVERVPEAGKYRFDQETRSAAIAMASKLGIDCNLNLNCLPQGLLVCPRSISDTLEQAARHRLPIERIILEVTECEVIADPTDFVALLNEYRARGLKVAIDDFGAGYSGLNLLADFQPDQIKIDMKLVRGIERSGPRQAIVRALVQACSDLGIDVVAEGVETLKEFSWFRDQGVALFQGYLFAKPGFQTLPAVRFDEIA